MSEVSRRHHMNRRDNNGGSSYTTSSTYVPNQNSRLSSKIAASTATTKSSSSSLKPVEANSKYFNLPTEMNSFEEFMDAYFNKKYMPPLLEIDLSKISESNIENIFKNNFTVSQSKSLSRSQSKNGGKIRTIDEEYDDDDDDNDDDIPISRKKRKAKKLCDYTISISEKLGRINKVEVIIRPRNVSSILKLKKIYNYAYYTDSGNEEEESVNYDEIEKDLDKGNITGTAGHLRNKSNQNKDKRAQNIIKKIIPNNSSYGSIVKLFHEKYKKSLILAKDKKHLMDKLIEQKSIMTEESILKFMDILLIYFVSFIYMEKKLLLEKFDISALLSNWKTLCPYIDWLISKIKVVINYDDFKNQRCSPLLGLCYQLRSIVYRYIIVLCAKKREFLNSTQQINKNDNGFSDLDYNNRMTSDFLKAESLIGYHILSNEFPKTCELAKDFQNKCYLMNQKQKNLNVIEAMNNSNNRILNDILNLKNQIIENNKYNETYEKRFNSFFNKLGSESILKNEYYLPFNPYLDPQQVVAYLYQLMSEWSDKYNYKYKFDVPG